MLWGRTNDHEDTFPLFPSLLPSPIQACCVTIHIHIIWGKRPHLTWWLVAQPSLDGLLVEFSGIFSAVRISVYSLIATLSLADIGDWCDSRANCPLARKQDTSWWLLCRSQWQNGCLGRNITTIRHYILELLIFIAYFFPPSSHSMFCFLSCRPLVVNATFSTGLVGCWVSCLLSWAVDSRSSKWFELQL